MNYKSIIDYTCDEQYCCSIDHLIKQRIVGTTIEAFETLFKEMQRAWVLEPEAFAFPIKVKTKLKHLFIIMAVTCFNSF